MQLPEDKESVKKINASIKRALEQEPFDIMCDYCIETLSPAFAIIENKLPYQDAKLIFDALRYSVNSLREIYKPKSKNRSGNKFEIMVYDANERLTEILNKTECMKRYHITKAALDKCLETEDFWCHRKYFGDLRRTYKFIKYT